MLLLGCSNTSSSEAEHQVELQLKCEVNLHSTASAIKTYAADNENSYPTSLAQLVPKYLPQVPTCPCAFDSNYASSYQSGPKTFTLFCKGAYHASQGLRQNYPRYSSQTGLLER